VQTSYFVQQTKSFPSTLGAATPSRVAPSLPTVFDFRPAGGHIAAAHHVVVAVVPRAACQIVAVAIAHHMLHAVVKLQV